MPNEHSEFFKPSSGQPDCPTHETTQAAKSQEIAWNISRSFFGNILTAHLPGMFVVNGRRGGYRAVSITGNHCELQCEHCKGVLLKSMSHATDGASLRKIGLDAYARGDRGILISGGCDAQGRLPWRKFASDIAYLKAATNLTITVHAGIVDSTAASLLKDAGVDQALVDVIGDDSTASQVYHLPFGVHAIRRSLENLCAAGIPVVPHILFGLHYGRVKGEKTALAMLGDYDIQTYVVVVLMPLSGAAMESVEPPDPEQAAHFLVEARLRYPKLRASLGCARPRGRYRRRLDMLAIDAGVNSIALPSDAALEYAAQRGLKVVFREWCCSLG